MSNEDIINAWRDEEYRASLDEAQRAALPESPIGPIDLSESDLEEIEGGTTTIPCVTLATALICLSFAGGGTCQEGTLGCCHIVQQP